MIYRDDDAQEVHRFEELATEARALERQIEPSLGLTPLLEQVTRTLDRAATDAARRRLRLIDRVEVDRPCAMRWEDLPGDLRRRHCPRCKSDVWDLSQLSSEEAEALLSRARMPCVRLTRRPDGSVVTKDCSPPWSAAARSGVALAVTLPWVAGAAFAVLPRLGGSRIEDARTDSLAVLSAAELYLAQDPTAACPTVADLVDERILNASTRTTDPFGNPFRIECIGDTIEVISDGPDGRAGTADDIR